MKKILVLISVLTISGAMFQIGRMSNTAEKNGSIVEIAETSTEVTEQNFEETEPIAPTITGVSEIVYQEEKSEELPKHVASQFTFTPVEITTVEVTTNEPTYTKETEIKNTEPAPVKVNTPAYSSDGIPLPSGYGQTGYDVYERIGDKSFGQNWQAWGSQIKVPEYSSLAEKHNELIAKGQASMNSMPSANENMNKAKEELLQNDELARLAYERATGQYR